ncbi:hypothetical protein MUK42_35970 [Musa troglodytarum]|uniref:Uncharacterized protein n=1 Tax=Musa troglodytarum TaxID=320322 RepID=A0A9E7FLW9_9LILI|nr:hypothetical protein MUK42_35970 [Musa troglodytarum]
MKLKWISLELSNCTFAIRRKSYNKTVIQHKGAIADYKQSEDHHVKNGTSDFS